MKATLTLFASLLLLLVSNTNLKAQAAQFKELAPGLTSSTPEQFTIVNGTMYFITIIDFRRALWKSDGTAANTVVVKDTILTTSVTDRVKIRGYIGDTLYYTVNESVQFDTTTELWMTTGSTPVLMATLTSSMLAGISNGEPRQYTVAGDKLYFQMYTQHGYELWVCDGTTAGTHEVTDLNPGSTSGIANEGALNVRMVGYNGKIYFSGTSVLGEGRLYSSDGTAQGTGLVKPTMTGDAEPGSFTVCNNMLYYYAEDGGSNGLWKTDGSANGTSFVANIGFNDAYVWQNSMYFAVAGSLWKSDGTANGTILLKDSAGQVKGAAGGYFYTGYMKFLTVAPYYEYYYWKSDGTPGGTVRVSDSLGASASFNVLNNKMYNASSGTALWETDGTDAGTKKIIDGIINYPTVFSNSVFFSNWGTGSGYELWSLAPTTTAIEEQQLDANSLNIYPNPSTGVFTIAGTKSGNYSLQVFNLLGEEVLQQSNISYIDLVGYARGTYFVRVSDGEKIYTQKIMLQQ